MNAVDTTNGYILDKAQIESTPLPTGSFTGVAILSTGVNAELPGGTGALSGLGNQPIWANGQRDTSNQLLAEWRRCQQSLQRQEHQPGRLRSRHQTQPAHPPANGAGGVIHSEASIYLSIGNAIPTPAPETIQEVRVNTSMYDASQGSTSGAHIDLSTSSGSNDIHGTAYYRRGTDWLNAAPFFFNQDGDVPANMKVPQLQSLQPRRNCRRPAHQRQALSLSRLPAHPQSPIRKSARRSSTFPSISPTIAPHQHWPT